MCQRLHESLVTQENLKTSVKNVKLLQQRLKKSRPDLEIKKKEYRVYDGSQHSLNKWLKANPVG